MAASPASQFSKKRSFRELNGLEKTQALHKRARDQKQSFLKRRINEILEENPDRIQDVVDCLELHGFDFKEITATTSPANKKRKTEMDEFDGLLDHGMAAAVGSSVFKSEDGEPENGVDGAGKMRVKGGIMDKNPQNWVPHRYLQLSGSSVVFLQQLMSQVEPLAFSKHALAPLLKAGRKEAKIIDMCRHLEYATTIDGDHSLRGDHRHIPSLVAWMTMLRDSEGRRCRDLLVPATWSARADGVYTFRVDGEALYVLDKSRGFEHEVPISYYMFNTKGDRIPFENYDITNNWSASKAKIVADNCNDEIMIIALGSFGRKGKRLAALVASSEASATTPNANDDYAFESRGASMVAVKQEIAAKQELFTENSSAQSSGGCVRPTIPQKPRESEWAPPVPAALKEQPFVGVAPTAAAEVEFEDDDYALADELLRTVDPVVKDELGPDGDETRAGFEDAA